MKIAFLHEPWLRILPAKPRGSLPIWTWHVSQRLQEQHEVYIYSRGYTGFSAYERRDNVQYVRIWAPLDRWIGPAVQALTHAAGRPKTSASLFHAQYYARAARDMRRKGIEIVHVHTFPQAAAIIRFFHPAVKIVVHIHVEWLNLLPPRVARHQMRDVDLLVSCSEYLSEKTRRALPASSAKIKTLYNGVDVDAFREEENPSPPQDREWRVLFVGRISPEKGIHVLVEAIQRLIEDGENLHLDLVGPESVAPFEVIVGISDSDMVSQLKAFYDTTLLAKVRSWLRKKFPRRLGRLRDTTYAATLRSMVKGDGAGRVRFVGSVPVDDLPRWYREADLLVQPSLYETFGMPVVEAMACGTPILATRTGGIPELIEDARIGSLVEPGNVHQLAEEIRRLLRNRTLRRHMGQEARKRAVGQFSWDKTVETLTQYYVHLLEQTGVAENKATAALTKAPKPATGDT